MAWNHWLYGFVALATATSVGFAGCIDGGGSELNADDDDGNGTGGTSSAGGGLGFGGNNTGGGGPIGGVPQTCAEAQMNQSYIGCEYWPTVTSNAGLYEGFEFAIVVANPTGNAAEVTIDRGGNQISAITVGPGEIQTVTLPWVMELKQVDADSDGSGITSVLATDGAYHVVSSVPVTVNEFNPLEFEITPPPVDCPDQAGDGSCSSFTNDASLLLPTTALRDDYYVITKPTFHIGGEVFGPPTTWSNLPGFVAITATADNTNVTVESSAHVRPGAGVGALTPGQTGNYTLNAGDVLMLQSAALPDGPSTGPNGEQCVTESDGIVTRYKCPSPPEYDLTGTHVTSDKPISVIGGHECTFVPYNQFACDHLEESMFPTETLGQELVVTAPHSVTSIGGTPQPDSMFVRVLSAADNNTITFDPAVSQQVTLGAGEWVEFGPVNQDFKVTGTDRIMVAQFMVGENFSGMSVGAGDPALSMAIPIEQYRVSYAFQSPVTYTHNFVNVVKPVGGTVSIDGQVISADTFTEIPGTGLAVSRTEVNGGYHTMEGDQNFGIVVYGYASYTSYMYPGGLNLETVIIVPQ